MQARQHDQVLTLAVFLACGVFLQPLRGCCWSAAQAALCCQARTSQAHFPKLTAQFSAKLRTSRRSLKGAGICSRMNSRCVRIACKTTANASGCGVDGTLMCIISCAQASLALAVRACTLPLLTGFCVYPCMLSGTQRFDCCRPPSLERSSDCKTRRLVSFWNDRLACLGSESGIARCLIALPRITAGSYPIGLL